MTIGIQPVSHNPHYLSCEHGNLEPTGEILLLFEQNVYQTHLAWLISPKYNSH